MRLLPYALAAFGATSSLVSGDDEKKPASTAGKASESTSIMWRFDGNGHFPNIDPPVEWGRERNILWKSTVGPSGFSSPIVVKDKVFVTEEMGSLICLDLADGRMLWKKDLFSKGSKDIPVALSAKLMRGCGGDSKESTPTPASNGEFVFYINAMGLCACYDLEGRQQWIRIIETAEDEELFGSSPIFVGDRIILSWGCLLALDAKDGRTLWKAPGVLPAYGTAVVTRIGGESVAITPTGAIVRLRDGEVLCTELFESDCTTPLVEGNVLYLIDAVSTALELPAKAEPGMQIRKLWKTKLRGQFMASPVLRDGLLYTIESKRCRLHVIDAETGRVLTPVGKLEKEKPGADVTAAGLKIDGLACARYAYASPVAAPKHIYLFDDAGNAALLAPGPDFKFAGANKLEDSCVGSPFFVDRKVVIRGRRSVYCIGTNP